MDVEAIDRCDELRKSVHTRFDLPPVVRVRPIMRELPHGLQLNALRRVTDRLPVWPSCCEDTSAKVDEIRFGGLEVERTYSITFIPSSWLWQNSSHVMSFGVAGGGESKQADCSCRCRRGKEASAGCG